MSASSMAVEAPFLDVSAARSEVTSDFPTPPFPLTIPITFFILLSLFIGSRKLFGSFLLSQSFAHDEQFELQFSLMGCPPDFLY